MLVDPVLTALWAQDRSSGLHGPALPDMDFRDRASFNVLSNFVSECGSTDFIETWSGYRPRLRAMISFWISVVPPKIDRTQRW